MESRLGLSNQKKIQVHEGLGAFIGVCENIFVSNFCFAALAAIQAEYPRQPL
jgi:hypothetical protein